MLTNEEAPFCLFDSAHVAFNADVGVRRECALKHTQTHAYTQTRKEATAADVLSHAKIEGTMH